MLARETTPCGDSDEASMISTFRHHIDGWHQLIVTFLHARGAAVHRSVTYDSQGRYFGGI